VRLAARRPGLHRGLTGASRAIAAENLWRAQRDGARAALIEEEAGAATPVAQHLERTLALVAEDAEALGCAAELGAARGIVSSGTSADRQMAAFEQARGRGLARCDALGAVVDWLAAATAPTPDGRGTP
jgi:glutamate---cysteine ligase / carboxylate-amine ligase